jgi:hypothetical protein
MATGPRFFTYLRVRRVGALYIICYRYVRHGHCVDCPERTCRPLS